MKTLLLMRHAEAAPAGVGGSDAERALTLRGQMQAQAVGGALQEQGIQPERICCSPARRTRETLDILLPAIRMGG